MTIVLCTGRLLDALGIEASGQAPLPGADGNRLGAWIATAVPLRPARLVLAVSEHARLPVVLALEPRDSLLQRLPEAVYELLLELKVPVELARGERAAMQPLQARAGVDQGSLGMLRACEIELRAAWERGQTRAPAELGALLAHQLSEHLDGASPAQAARRRFHLTPEYIEPLGL
jgi:hypothetical protein